MKYSPDQIDDTGNFLKDGTFYCVCVGAEPISGQYGDEGFELTWEALSPSSHAGKTIKDRIWGSGKAAPRFKLAAKACGLRTSGMDVEILPEDFLNKHLWVTVTLGKPWTGKDGVERQNYQVSWDGYDASTPAPEGLEDAEPESAKEDAPF